MQPEASTPTTKELAAARADLDRWAHYSDRPGFIARAGGQEAYNAEHERRLRRFTELDTRLD